MRPISVEATRGEKERHKFYPASVTSRLEVDGGGIHSCTFLFVLKVVDGPKGGRGTSDCWCAARRPRVYSRFGPHRCFQGAEVLHGRAFIAPCQPSPPSSCTPRLRLGGGAPRARPALARRSAGPEHWLAASSSSFSSPAWWWSASRASGLLPCGLRTSGAVWLLLRCV